MHLRLVHSVSAACVGLALAASAPAMAHEGSHTGLPPQPQWGGTTYGDAGPDMSARDAWLADCRERLSHRDNGVGGAVIGGLVGGIAGNRIAGSGNRTVGTIAGAAVGAAVGMAIDKGEDKASRDECEAYLDDYYSRQQAYYPGYGAQGYYQGYPGYQGYSYGGCCGQPMMLVPIVRVQRAEPECTETVEYEYEYVDVPARPAPVKRVKVVPDKRIKVAPDKRIPAK